MAGPIIPPLRKVKRAHGELMAAYARALREAAQLRFVGRHGFGFMARFVTESHVRAQLQHLIAAYAVIEQSLGPDRTEAKWYSDAGEQLDRASAALRNLGGSVAALTPLPAIGAFVGISSSLGVWPDWETPVLILVLGAAIVVGFHYMHRRGKRMVFAQRGSTVERLETLLFRHLPLNRRRDLPNALVGLVVAACLIAGGSIVLTVADDSKPLLIFGASIVWLASISVWFALFGRLIHRSHLPR